MRMNIGRDVQIHKNVSPLSSSKIEGGNKKEDVYSGFESKLKTGDGFGVNPLGLKKLEDYSNTGIYGSSHQKISPMTEEEKKFEEKLKADGKIPENFEEAMETALQQAEDMGDDIDIKKDSQQQPTDATDKTGDRFGVNPLGLEKFNNYSNTGTFDVSEQGIPDNVNVPDGETVLSSSTPTSTAPSVINTSVESFGRLNTETTESESVHGGQQDIDNIDIKAKTIEYQTKMSDLQDLQQTTKQSLMNKLDELGVEFDKTKLFKLGLGGNSVPNCDLSSLDDDTRRNVQEMFNDLRGIGQQINDLKHKYSGNFIT